MSESEALLQNLSSMTADYPISQYNDVVQVYNDHSGSSVQLVYLDGSLLYMRLYGVQKTTLGKVVMLLTFLVPLVNILLLTIVVKCFVFLNRQQTKRHRNLVMVPDPFQQFYLDDDLCAQLGKPCSSLTLTAKQLQGFTFNRSLAYSLSSNERVEVTLYSREFMDFYFGIPRHWRELLLWMVLGSLEAVLSTVLLAVLISH